MSSEYSRLLQYFFIIGSRPDKPLQPILSEYDYSTIATVEDDSHTIENIRTTNELTTPIPNDGRETSVQVTVPNKEDTIIHTNPLHHRSHIPLINPKKHDVGPILLLDQYPSVITNPIKSSSSHSHHTKPIRRNSTTIPSIPLPEGIINLAFPTGYRIRRGKEGAEPLPEFFTSVLCNEYGTKFYGHFLILYEKITSIQQKYFNYDIIEPWLHDNIIFYIPKCIGFYSQYNYPIIRHLLTTLYRYSITPSQTIPLERFIQWMINDIPVPPSGYIDIHIPLAHNELYRLRAPPRNARISALNKSTNLRIMMECLSLINIVYIIFYGLMLENQIIFVSSQLSLLTIASEAFLTLLYPFRWLHPYIPILPKACSEFLQMPTPFIVGIETHIFNTLEKNNEIPPYVLIVRLDTNSLSFSKPIPDNENNDENNYDDNNIIHPYDTIFNPSSSTNSTNHHHHHSSSTSSTSSIFSVLSTPSKAANDNDTNSSSNDYGWNSLPPLPSTALRTLLTTLERIGNAYQLRDSDWSISILPSMDSAFSFAMRPGEFDTFTTDDDGDGNFPNKEETVSHVRAEACSCSACTEDQALLNNSESLINNNGTVDTPSKPTAKKLSMFEELLMNKENSTAGMFCAAGVRHAFLRYFLSLLYKYQQSFKESVEDNTKINYDTQSSSFTLPQFIPDIFLNQTWSENRPFLREFFNTQMWNDFIDKYNPYQLIHDTEIYKKEEFLDLLFLKESMDRHDYQTSTKTKLLHFTTTASTTPSSLPYVTPFLDSHIDDFITTITLLSPDTIDLPNYPEQVYTYSYFPIKLNTGLFTTNIRPHLYDIVRTTKNITVPMNHQDIYKLYNSSLLNVIFPSRNSYHKDNESTTKDTSSTSLVTSLLSFYKHNRTNAPPPEPSTESIGSSALVPSTPTISTTSRVLSAWKKWIYSSSTSSQLANRIRSSDITKEYEWDMGPTEEGLRYHSQISYPFSKQLLLTYYTVWLLGFILHFELAKIEIAKEITIKYNQDMNNNINETIDKSITNDTNSTTLYNLIKKAQNTYLHQCFDIIASVLHRIKVYDHLQPTEFMYRICIETSAYYGEFDYAYNLLNEMMTRGYIVDSKLVKLLYSAYTAKNLYSTDLSASSPTSLATTTGSPSVLSYDTKSTTETNKNIMDNDNHVNPKESVQSSTLIKDNNSPNPVIVQNLSYAPSWWYTFQRSRWQQQHLLITPRKGSVMATQYNNNNQTTNKPNVRTIEGIDLQTHNPDATNITSIKASITIYKTKNDIHNVVRKSKSKNTSITATTEKAKVVESTNSITTVPPSSSSRPVSARLSAPASVTSNINDSLEPINRKRSTSIDHTNSPSLNTTVIPPITPLPMLPPPGPPNTSRTKIILPKRAIRPGSTAAVIIGTNKTTDTNSTTGVAISTSVVTPAKVSLPETTNIPTRTPSLTKPDNGNIEKGSSISRTSTNESTSISTSLLNRLSSWAEAVFDAHMTGTDSGNSDFSTAYSATELASLANMDPSLMMVEAPSEWQHTTTSSISNILPNSSIAKESTIDSIVGIDDETNDTVDSDEENSDKEIDSIEKNNTSKDTDTNSTTSANDTIDNHTTSANIDINSTLWFERLAYGNTNNNHQTSIDDSTSTTTTMNRSVSNKDNYILSLSSLLSNSFPTEYTNLPTQHILNLSIQIIPHICTLCHTTYIYSDIYTLWEKYKNVYEQEIGTFCSKCLVISKTKVNSHIRLDDKPNIYENTSPTKDGNTKLKTNINNTNFGFNGLFQPYMNIDYEIFDEVTNNHTIKSLPIEWLSPYTLQYILYQEYQHTLLFIHQSNARISSGNNNYKNNNNSSSYDDNNHDENDPTDDPMDTIYANSIYSSSSILYWNMILLCQQMNLPIKFLHYLSKSLVTSSSLSSNDNITKINNNTNI